MTAKEKINKVDNEVNELVSKAQVALKGFMDLDQEQIDHIVAKASVAALDQHGTLALSAVKETGRGVFEDKATKNLFACEHVINHMRHLKTVGIIDEDETMGITSIADPVGVVCGLTPVTNPTSTTIFKSLICLKPRNPIIFSFILLLLKVLKKQLGLYWMRRLQRVHLRIVFNGWNMFLKKKQRS